MYKHVFLFQCVNVKIFPVAFHCDSTGEKFDKTNKNSQMNNSEYCAKRCPVSKVWGSLILEPKAWTLSSIPVYKGCSLPEVSQLSFCSAQAEKRKPPLIPQESISLPSPFISILPVPQSPPQIPPALGILDLWCQQVTLSFSSYTFCVFRVHHVMGILSH